MNQPLTELEQADAVSAELRYFVDTGEAPVNIPSEAGSSELSRFTGSYEDRTVRIQDGRGQSLSVDQAGFELIQHDSEVGDFYDDVQIERTYNAEVERLVMKAMGARRAVVFDHTRRSGSQSIREKKGIREPAKSVHNDHTDRSAARRLHDEMPDEAESLLKRRFAIVNVWRPVEEPVESNPLALCDSASVALTDLIASERRSKERIGEIQLATFNPAHRWFYFPDMRRNEVLLIKVYDSADDGRARFAIHTSFDDPNSPPDAAPRESIETRTFAFF